MTHTPETAAAHQVLLHACDTATKAGRVVLFRAIAHLMRDTRPERIAHIERNWQATR